MHSTLKFLLALVVALIAMLAFRALAFTTYTVTGSGLEPVFVAGDRVLVNRWSYGLRTGADGSLFSYGRICRQPVAKGDYVAFEDSLGQILICQCAAVPGDTISLRGRREVVPGLFNCSRQDYYWLRSVNPQNPLDSRQMGFIPESSIVGRACLIIYSHDPSSPLWDGYLASRFLLLP